MELLLLQDIPGIGVQFQVVKVDRQLALDKFLPERRALVLTRSVRKRFESQIRRVATSLDLCHS
jgi:hypothetical protein